MPLTCKDVACRGQYPRGPGGTFLVKKRSGRYPRLAVDGPGREVACGAHGVLLTRTTMAVALDAELSAALAPWRKPFARHDLGKIVPDLAISLALGGTAWPTSPGCGRIRRCSGRSPRIRRCPGASTPSPPTRLRRWPRSRPPGPWCGPGCGRPPLGPGRGPHPRTEGQRPGEPAAARLRPETSSGAR